MSRLESALIHIAVGALCPAAGFFIGWWSAAGLTLYGVLSLSETAIAAAALAGLGVGVLLDGLLVRRWAASFYDWDSRWLALLYLGGSLVAVALFMGFPLGNLVWGTLAGVYLGRRERHRPATRQALGQAARRGSLFTATVTAVEALPIGLMALDEGIVVGMLQAALRWSPQQIAGLQGSTLVMALCLVLAALQMWLTGTAAGIAFGRPASTPAER